MLKNFKKSFLSSKNDIFPSFLVIIITTIKKVQGEKVNFKNKKGLVSLSVATALALSLNAEDSVTKLNEVTVVNTAFDAQVKSISSADLEEEQASSVQDILRKLPSVEVGGNTRYGQKVYVRGLEDKFANVTIDGAKVGGQLFHHAGDQTIDASLLKVSEVELGPNSALSGPGVVVGTFEYETKDPSDYLRDGEDFGGQVSAGYETARERKKASAALFGKVNDKVELVGMYSKTDDGTLDISDGTKEADKVSELESILGKVVFKPSDDSTIKASYNTYEDGGNRNISGEKTGKETNTQPYSSIERDTISVKYEYNPSSELIDLEASVYDNDQTMTRAAQSQTSSRTGKTTNYPERKYVNTSRGYDIRNTSIISDHKLTYGTDFNKEDQKIEASGLKTVSDGTSASSARDGGEIDAKGLYIQDEFAIDKLLLTLGARYDKHELGGIYSGSFSQVSPKAKAKYLATDNLTLRAGYGKIFKGPALGETLMLEWTDVEQSADTKPQKGKNIEVGFDYDFSSSLDADEAIVGFTTYKYNVNDYAHPTKNNNLTSQGKMEINGFETMFSYNKDKLGITASHTYTDGEQTDADGNVDNPVTAKIHVFKAATKYKISDELKVGYNLEYVPSNEYKSYSSRSKTTSTVKRNSYNVHYANLTYKPAGVKDLSIFFGIDNIFNKKYIRHTSFGSGEGQTWGTYELARNYKFTATYRF